MQHFPVSAKLKAEHCWFWPNLFQPNKDTVCRGSLQRKKKMGRNLQKVKKKNISSRMLQHTPNNAAAVSQLLRKDVAGYSKSIKWSVKEHSQLSQTNNFLLCSFWRLWNAASFSPIMRNVWLGELLQNGSHQKHVQLISFGLPMFFLVYHVIFE